MGETQGDFAAFYAGGYQRMVTQIYVTTGDLGAAEEAAQEAYVQAWSRWSRLSAYENPSAWVYLVGCRIAVSHWRRVRTSVATMTRAQTGRPDVPPPSEDTVALVAALRQLPLEQRQSLVLHYLGGWSVEEIATAEDRPSGTIKARLSRGRAALAVLLDDSHETEVTDYG